MAEIDYNTVIAAMRKGDPGSKGDPGIGWTPTLLYQQNLNDVTTAGTYRTTGSTAITLANNYPLAAVAGTVEVQSRILSGEPYGPSCVQEFVPFFGVPNSESRMILRRTLTGGVWQPWRSYTSQRIDNIAGTKAVYTWDDTTNAEQLIYGDTGWLDIATLFEVDWVVTSSIIRRVNNLVTINLEGIKCATPPSSNPAFFKPPVGFKPEVALNNSMGNQRVGYITELSGTNGKIISPENGGAGLRFLGYTANLTLHGSIMYYTRDPWPTTTPTAIAGTPGKPM